MRHRWLVFLLLLALLASITPVQAEIITVEPPPEEEEEEEDGEAPEASEEMDVREPLLTPEEIEKIDRLQTTTFQTFVSGISPDDQTVLTGTVIPNDEADFGFDVFFSFLNIQDGSNIRVEEDFLERFLPLSNIAWSDANTAVFLSLDENFEPALALMDKNTGTVISQPIGDLPGFPVSLAPNASGLLIVLPPEDEEEEEAAEAEEEPPPDEDPIPDEEPVPEPDQPEGNVYLNSPFDIRVQVRPPHSMNVPPGMPDPAEIFKFQDDTPTEEVAVTSDEEQLAYLNLKTGEVVPLMGIPEGTSLTSMPTWSQDGSKLAFTRVTIDLGNTFRGSISLNNLLTRDALGLVPPEDNPFLQTNVVDIFDLAGEEVRKSQIRATDGNGDIFAGVSWSTDGFTLLTRMQRPGRLEGRTHPSYIFPESSYIRFYDLASEQVVGVFEAPEIAAPTIINATFVTPDEVIFNTVYGLSFRIYYYNRVSGELREISDRSGFYTQVLPTRFSRQVVFNYAAFDRPPDLFRLNWDGTARAALTYNNVELEEFSQIQVNEVTFTMANGEVRYAYLVQPEGAAFPPQNEPIVVWQEGGPGLFMTNNWGTNVENPYSLLPNFGISVLVMPLQGREGWGPEFYKDLSENSNFGAVDIDDAAQAVRQMIARGYTSSDRVGITGCSYGGYFASQSITRHPNLYAAANTQCTLLDTITEWQTGFTPLMSYLVGVPPTANSARFLADSPGFQAEQIRTPTLIFHGEFDFLPVSIAETFHVDIEETGTPVRMLKFELEGHGLGLPENQLLAAQEQINWFRRYLGGTAPAAEPGSEPEETPEQGASEAEIVPAAPPAAPAETAPLPLVPPKPAVEQPLLEDAPAAPGIAPPVAPAAAPAEPQAPAEKPAIDTDALRSSLVRGIGKGQGDT